MSEKLFRLGVVGSRSFDRYHVMKAYLNAFKFAPFCIVSGGAAGADSLARRYAIEKDIPIREFLPDWKKEGKRAGYLRNAQIVNNSDGVIAFWDQTSKGTLHSIRLAQATGILLYVYKY